MIQLVFVAFLLPVASGVCSDAVYSHCCVRGRMNIDLIGGGNAPQPIPGVQIMGDTGHETNHSSFCSHKLLLKVRFDPPSRRARGGGTCNACQSTPACGRSMLRITLYLNGFMLLGHANPDNWLIHIAESRRSIGQVNRNRTTGVEFVGKGDNLHYIPRSSCASPHSNVSLGSFRNKTDVSIYVSNQHVRVDDYQECSSCLFNVSRGDNSTKLLYIGINRSVGNLFSTGGGVCLAVLTWVCPWCVHAP